jgi:anaerobic selenocysteine-containing dehydrogenase
MRRRPLGKRGYLVQFEPRLSSTGASADEWVAIRPGAEGLVALGLGKILVQEGLLEGSEYASLYDRVDPSAVLVASGVRAEVLERLAHIFASVDAPLAIPGGAVTGQPEGAAAQAAVQALNLLGGRLGEPGGVFLSEPSSGEDFAPPRVSTYAEVEELIADMSAGRVQVLMVHSANPVFELPPAAGFHEALANVPVVISFSPTVDETAAQANLILPDHTNMEGWGYHVPALADRRLVTSQQPVMRPLYDTRASVDVLLALAQALGGAVSEALPWPNEVDFLRETVNQLNHGSVSPEVFWAQWRRRGGQWASEPEMVSPSVTGGFDAPLAVTAPDARAEDADHPFHLYLYPSISLYDGRGANKAWLQETPDPMTTVSWQTWIEVHPHTAEELGLESNDIVRVISPEGEVRAIVYVYPAIEEGVVAMPVGQGHENYGRFAQNRGSNPVRLLVRAVEEETGALAWEATRVRIEPTGEKKQLARLESPAGVEFMLEGH